MGVFAALGTALCWAIAARLFSGTGNAFSPLTMNFWKGLISILLLGLVLLFVPPMGLNVSIICWLLISGFIGIGIGDTCFFKALKSIGDSQAVLVAETLAPLFTALFAMAFIGEWITWQQWVGVAIVLLSVDMVIKARKRSTTHVFATSGYLYGVAAALCQAVGAVVSRDILGSGDVDAASAAFLRLIGGMFFVVPLIACGKTRWLPAISKGQRIWPAFILATLLGTTAAIYLQMFAFAYAKAAVVQTLIATSALMSLGVAWVLGEKATKATILWSIVALIGVAVLVSFGAPAGH
ncbi:MULTISPECIES: DMT family transporter [Alteromonas]|jgi:drug/metabolite transporter (DMT)-like permease|uniref:Multidrug DMT transporter permease n=2 Tax=Alteromonas australica TaxID=589873 RepID=A0A075NY36_9ALTE|nr:MULTISPECIES: DMT family transporter [Alteromonas]AIF97535.1 multidrug DMT transporter permease [Alteromonas australica]QPL50425.1 DMT family transporter [Alteromonas sp. B31-7]|tara:strand:+ start:11149 stop:12033 length:885 start_codon:yes stop_codon:yes gene_type:complete